MSLERTYAVAERSFVEELAERVVRRLAERQRRILVVCTGARLGEARAASSLRALRAEGLETSVLLSRSAAAVLDVAALRDALDPAEVWVEKPGVGERELLSRCGAVVVPTLTVKTAASIASCMADTPASSAILGALMRQMTVIAAIDGCCPDNPERDGLGYAMPEALKQQLRNNIDALRSFGMRFTLAERLGDRTMEQVGRMTFVGPHGAPAPTPGDGRDQDRGATARKGVLVAADVRGAARGSTLRIVAGTPISPLAADEARARGVCIVREREDG